MSKQSSAPISDFSSSALARSSRSLRSRSKLMRSSQSTAIVPYVFRPTTSLHYKFQDCRIAEWQDWEIPKSILPSCNSAILQFTIAYIPFCHSRSRTQFLRDPHDVLLARDRRIFQLRRKRNGHVHRAQPGNRRVEVVEGALRDNL